MTLSGVAELAVASWADREGLGTAAAATAGTAIAGVAPAQVIVDALARLQVGCEKDATETIAETGAELHEDFPAPETSEEAKQRAAEHKADGTRRRGSAMTVGGGPEPEGPRGGDDRAPSRNAPQARPGTPGGPHDWDTFGATPRNLAWCLLYLAPDRDLRSVPTRPNGSSAPITMDHHSRRSMRLPKVRP